MFGYFPFASVHLSKWMTIGNFEETHRIIIKVFSVVLQGSFSKRPSWNIQAMGSVSEDWQEFVTFLSLGVGVNSLQLPCHSNFIIFLIIQVE